MTRGDGVQISVIVPVLDEQDTIATLVDAIRRVAAAELAGRSLEIVLIDDGSRDGSWPEMRRLAASFPEVRACRLRRNFGKSAALAVGSEIAAGDVLVTMDADLQDDPEELPRFMAKLDEGYDLVSGWKENRNDPLGKTLPSRFFNAVTRSISRLDLHDFNCGFKAARREVYRDISLYGELHRYIPVLAHSLGYRVAEIPVKHHPRRHGVSKFGWERYARGFLDLLTVLTITRFGHRPGHLFGGLGILVGLIGFVTLAYLTILWLAGETIGTRPLLLFGIMAELLSAQLLTLGMLAELILHRTRQGSALSLVAETDSGPLPRSHAA